MKHIGSIELESERLFFRALKESDADNVFKNWTSNDEVSRYVKGINVDEIGFEFELLMQ